MTKKNSKKLISNNKNGKNTIHQILECGKTKCSKTKNTNSCMKKHCLKLINNIQISNLKKNKTKIKQAKNKTKKCRRKYCSQYFLDKPKLASCIKRKCKKEVLELTRELL